MGQAQAPLHATRHLNVVAGVACIGTPVLTGGMFFAGRGSEMAGQVSRPRGVASLRAGGRVAEADRRYNRFRMDQEPPPASVGPVAPPTQAVRRIGCVSYLNARPLIEGLDDGDEPTVRFDVPARLLSDLESGEVDIALCPVIDYHRSHVPLVIVPAGGIGCAGTTLTVRLFSRVPLERVRQVYVDSESHTSVVLLRVLLAERYGLRPELVTYHAREQVAGHRLTDPPETMLLIGDKVVTDSPRAIEYPHQLDLGQAWHEMTGLPFVFAVWMTRQGVSLGDLPQRLIAQRRANCRRITAIADRDAPRHGWPRDLARQYLGQILRYAVDERELEAIARFSALAAAHRLIDENRPLEVHPMV